MFVLRYSLWAAFAPGTKVNYLVALMCDDDALNFGVLILRLYDSGQQILLFFSWQ